jgi:hypothetical protein
MTSAAEAREFITKHDLGEHVARIVDQAPPLPERVAETWSDAARRSIRPDPARYQMQGDPNDR